MILATCDLIAFVSTAHPLQARGFYANVLGLRLVSDDPFALEFDAHGTMLRVTKVQMVHPAPYTVLGWRVPDLTLAVSELGARGVKFEKYDGLAQDAAGVWASSLPYSVAHGNTADAHTLWLPMLARGQANPLHQGEATYYSATGAGACSFDASPGDLNVAAMDAPEYDNAAACGAYVHLTGPKG